MLQTYDLNLNSDTRLSEANPGTNYRTSDLGIYKGTNSSINTVLLVPLSNYTSNLDLAQIESVILYLTPKSKIGTLDTLTINCGAITLIALDIRLLCWNLYDATEGWTDPGGISDVDGDSIVSQSITHVIDNQIEIDITTPIKKLLSVGKFSTDVLLWTNDTGNGFMYYSSEDVTSKKAKIIVNYKGSQFTERMGASSMPAMPGL